MPHAILAIDIGTQSNRAALLDTAGTLLALAATPIDLSVPQAGWAEQNPNDWWRNTVHNVRAVLESARAAHGDIDVLGIGVCGHMHGTVPLGADGRVLTDAVQLWCDKRAAALTAEIAAMHNPHHWLTATGNVPSPAWLGFKLAWMQRHQPDLYRAAATILTPKDTINFRLTGVLATDFSEASGTFLMDSTTRQWSPAVADALGLDSGKLPTIAPGSAVIGQMTAEAAAQTGLRAGIPVVAGAGDMLCLLLGMGVIAPGATCDITGSSEIINFYAEQPVLDSRLMNLHGAGPGWIAFGILDSGGIALKWWKDNFGEPQIEAAKRAGTSPYDLLMAEAAQVLSGAEGLFFLPYLNGERTLGSADSRGVYFGLHMRHRRAHLTRALLEGVCFEMRQSIDIVRDRGVPVTEISTGGGGARSALWSQIKADVYGVPVKTVQGEEAGLVGAMILAGVGCGLFASEAAGVAQLVRTAARFTPNAATQAAYATLFPVYRHLHDVFQAPFKLAAEATAALAKSSPVG
jgi:sugar (pentulose or hexulose) kinase